MQIETENLGKRFNREWIFKHLTYTFKTGHCYAILGPNGTGKSTLLQTLWGQMLPSTGTINYVNNGRPIPQEDWFKQIAIATPYMDLIDEFSLREMVDFHFKFKKLRDDIKPNEVMDRMELAHAQSKIISRFSSGMRQRLKLALAFYSKAQALFLDEPTTNLDSGAVDWYQRQLAGTSGQILIIASNQPHEYPTNAIKIHIPDFK